LNDKFGLAPLEGGSEFTPSALTDGILNNQRCFLFKHDPTLSSPKSNPIALAIFNPPKEKAHALRRGFV
jgi:hypothetical protein